MSKFQYDIMYEGGNGGMITGSSSYIPWEKCSKCGGQAILEESVVIEPKRNLFEKLFNQQVDKIVTCKSCSIEKNRNDKIDSLLY